jgi:hypothetical protein
MLKRNGEICQIEVPDYPGRLTATEKRAYTAAIAVIEDQLRDLAEAGRALADVEKQIPQWKGEISAAPGTPTLNGNVEGIPGNQWHVVKTLVKTSRSELLFCSRALEEGREFAVFEKFDSNSAYAQAQGNPELILTSNNASLLLQDYVESERRMLQLVKQNIEAAVEESLTEKFPGEDNSRVVKAISARCGKCIAPAGQDVQPPRHSQNVRVRF